MNKSYLKNIARNYNQNNTPHSLNRIKFRTTQGFKGDNDKVLQLNTFNNWVNVTFPDLLEILRHFFENEERIYPKSAGFKGKDYLFEAITELFQGISLESVLEKYGHHK